MMSVVSAVIDLTSDPDDTNVAKRPIELLCESSDDEVTLKVAKNRRKRRHLKRPEEDVVVVDVVVLEDDLKVPSKSPLLQVLEVFPDVQSEHVEQLLQQNQSSVAIVLQILAENGSYPKAAAVSMSERTHTKHALIAHRHEGRVYKYDFMSGSSFEPDAVYKNEAKDLLMQDFGFLSSKIVSIHLALAKNHYAICHQNICHAIMLRDGAAAPKEEADEYEQYVMLEQAFKGILVKGEKQRKYLNTANYVPIQAVWLKRRRLRTAYPSHEILTEEIEFLKEKQNEFRSRMQSYKQRIDARYRAEATSSTIECNCCYSNFSPDEMVQCRGGHLFCCDCLRKMSETHIFANGNFGIHPITKEPATELLCMAGCGEGFLIDILSKALPKQVLEKYNEMQFKAVVSKVQMEDLCSCPQCGYQAELPATEKIFRCPVGDCAYESCRSCGEEPHIPFKCEEVEKKRQTKGRLRVEEAISEAKIRTCPKPGCGKKFVKDYGCNRMTCACGTFICYICRKQMDDGYRHFCQAPLCDHKKCQKCALYTDSAQDDEQAMREAGIKAAEEVRGESLQGDKASEGEVTVDVDGILKVPGNEISATAGHNQPTDPLMRLLLNRQPGWPQNLPGWPPPILGLPPIAPARRGRQNPKVAPRRR